MNLHVTATVYAIIFVAEIPDKTALASLVLATRNPPLPVFVGASLALTVQSVIAVAAGQLLTLLPTPLVHTGTGVVFLVSAIFMWRRSDGDATTMEAAPLGFSRTVAKAFAVVFVAEWGDLTQIGTGALAVRYAAPAAVFVGATLALWSVVALAVFVGNRAANVLRPELTKRVAAVVFAAVGGALMAGWL